YTERGPERFHDHRGRTTDVAFHAGSHGLEPAATAQIRTLLAGDVLHRATVGIRRQGVWPEALHRTPEGVDEIDLAFKPDCGVVRTLDGDTDLRSVAGVANRHRRVFRRQRSIRPAYLCVRAQGQKQ